MSTSGRINISIVMMKLNRRNALLALGTIAASGGTAIATGAFSSLSADRTVTINIASDEKAVLALEVDDNYAGLSDSDENTDVIELNFNRLNQNAVTRFDNALTITNNGSNQVELSIETTDLDDTIRFFPPLTEDDPTKIDADGGKTDITIVADLKTQSDRSGEITITATAID